MNCEKVCALLSEYHDGELKEPLAREVETHLCQCKACAGELASFEAMGGMFKSNNNVLHSTSAPAWNQLESQLVVADKRIPARTAITSHRRLALASAAVLAASILFIVSLSLRKNSESDTHEHNHAHEGNAAVVIDFEKLLHEESNQPRATLVSLSDRFEGQEADPDESETQLGYKPSISRALPNGVKLVSNRILKLPHCNCPTGACNCGPTGCNCSASLCKRADGSEFLVVEHCATQNISFGHLKSELLAEKGEVQLMSDGKQLVASWITGNRRLTAIGLSDNTEAQAIVASVAAF